MEIIQMATYWIHKKVLEMSSNLINKDTKILIAACWKWAFEKVLVEEYWILPSNITSLDIDENYHYEKCKLNFKKCDLNQPFTFIKNNSYDLIISIETIEHLNNQFNVINEFYRILKKNWNIIITSPNCESIASRIFYMFKWVFPSFTDVNFKLSWHIVPFFSWSLKNYLDWKKLKIISYVK